MKPVTFMVEPWSQVWRELQPLWDAHWQEVALHRDEIKLAIDFDAYAQQEAMGCLQVMVARCEGFVVGYHLSFIHPHLHYRNSLSAYSDVYFIDPNYRKGATGINLFKEVEKAWIARGVQRAFTGTKLSLDMGRIFEHLGWSESERTYCKLLKAKVE